MMILADVLQQMLERDPAKIKDVLKAVGIALEHYEDAVRRNRDETAYNAIANIIPFCWSHPKFQQFTASQKIAYTIDAMMYLFPLGKPLHHSTHEINAFIEFRNLCKETNMLEDGWLMDTKGQAGYDFIKKVIES